MSDKVKLKPENIVRLIRTPRSGKGYHIVDIHLKDGTVLKDRIILNASFVKLEEGDDYNVDDIRKIVTEEEK